jgi:hypothetical protein
MSDQKEPAELPLVRVDNPFPLLDKMIERGTDVVALGKMMDMAEHWKKMQAIEAFAAAMVRCQQRLPAIVRDAINKNTRSRYPKLETVNAAIVPVYTEEGFSVSFTEGQASLPGKIRIVAEVTHELGHVKSYWRDLTPDLGKGPQGGQLAMTPIQAEGSTDSYGRRYLLYLVFNLTVADEDNDGSAESGGELLTSTQIESMNELISEIRELGAPFDETKFLAFMLGLEKGEERGDRTLAHSPQDRYGPGMENLTFKLKNAKARKAGGK